jgi:hypothetical protein
MNGLHICAMGISFVIGLSGWALADSSDWLPQVQQVSSRTDSGLLTFNPSAVQNELSPARVFCGSGESLILTSCSSPECGCDDPIDGFNQSSCGHTWVQFTPYAWATQMRGDLTVDGLTAPMNIDLNDLWNLLENGAVRGGFMGHLEFGRDNWSLFVNGDIVSMDPSVQVRRANIETGLTMTLLELGGAVDLFNANESDPVNSPLRVQMIGGVRYNAVDAGAILSLPNVNPVVDVSSSEQWVDLFVGGRVITQITPGMNGFVRGDVGGFGIGTSSDHAWNLVSGVTTDCIWGSSLLLGYRVFDIDQTLNGGTGSPQGFGVDAVIHGPLLGLTFQF